MYNARTLTVAFAKEGAVRSRFVFCAKQGEMICRIRDIDSDTTVAVHKN